MTRRRTGEPFMPPPEYGRSLAGLGVNLLVADIERALPFQREVLDAEVVYHDPDIAVLRRGSAEWMLHAHHTYDAHPLYDVLVSDAPRGVGAEIRLHGRDPDEAQAVAHRLGYRVIAPAADKPHGLRETFIADESGYVWVPGVASREDA